MRRSSEKCSVSARLATSANVGGATRGLGDVEHLERTARGRPRSLVPQRAAEDAVQLARRDAAMPVLGDVGGRLEDPRDPAAGRRRRQKDRAHAGRRESARPGPSGNPRPCPPRACPPTSHLLATRTSPRPASAAYAAIGRVLPGRPLGSRPRRGGRRRTPRCACAPGRPTAPRDPARSCPAAGCPPCPRGETGVRRPRGSRRRSRGSFPPPRTRSRGPRRAARSRATTFRRWAVPRRRARSRVPCALRRSPAASASPAWPEAAMCSPIRVWQVVDADVVLGRDAEDLGKPERPCLDFALAALAAVDLVRHDRTGRRRTRG